jgi:MFS family permease
VYLIGIRERSLLNKIKSLGSEFPSSFRILVAATFIDRLGGRMIFPFFSLYITQHFNVSMTQIGLLFGLWSISSMVSSMIGGVLTDKFERKKMIVYGLVISATSSILMGLVDDLRLFAVIIVLVGLLAEAGGPVQSAMVADLLPEEKRTEGFGVLRVLSNIAWVIGPAVGGLLVGISYLLLFILDAISSAKTAGIVHFTLPLPWDFYG